ncbi:CDP-alcohol phosphatidyltransferase family protein [Lichenicoccus sp.]|uniref:CDP-alcohol phosphatidyltransferase family protein n=1 Tax=Lichenicoccus sp. TaxID=2781899 RepID=UPI003D0B3A5A
MQTPEPVRRTSEIEDPTNLYVIHAMANRLTPLLARLHIRPNTVSVAGMLFGILAGFAYFRYHNPLFALAGFILMIAWHVMDGVDGQLARLTHTQSESGKVLDGVCDYVTFIAVYTGLALNLSCQHGSWVWGLVIAAGACHAVQAAAYEVQRQQYEFWGWDRKSKEITAAKAAAASKVFGAYRLYTRVQVLAVGFSADFQQRLTAIFSRRPEHVAAIRLSYRETFAQPVRRWSILSANSRTIGIFICALLQVPLCYFIFEVAGFSLVLAVLSWQQKRRHGRFLASLDELE